MADISNVQGVLVKTIATVVYPELTYDEAGVLYDKGHLWDGPKGPSITGTDIIIYPGWPSSANLAADLANDKTHVTVFTRPEERNTTRFPETEQVIGRPVTSILLRVFTDYQLRDFDEPAATWDSGTWDGSFNNTVMLDGTVTVDQNLALRINNQFYVVTVATGATLEDTAAALGALVAVDIPDTTVIGTSIAIGPNGRLQAARVGGFGTVAKEVRRQERLFQISVWAANPGLRDQITSAVDVALAQIRFLELPDGFGGRLTYKNSVVTDGMQKDLIYRRDLNYMVEYPTTVSRKIAAVIAPSVNVADKTFTY